LQLDLPINQENSIAHGLAACEKACAMGTDLAVFPELWQVGYRQELFTLDNAIDIRSVFIQQFCAKAKELEI